MAGSNDHFFTAIPHEEVSNAVKASESVQNAAKIPPLIPSEPVPSPISYNPVETAPKFDRTGA